MVAGRRAAWPHEGLTRSCYLRRIDASSRRICAGKASLDAEMASIFDRLGLDQHVLEATVSGLFEPGGRISGRLLSFSIASLVHLRAMERSGIVFAIIQSAPISPNGLRMEIRRRSHAASLRSSEPGPSTAINCRPHRGQPQEAINCRPHRGQPQEAINCRPHRGQPQEAINRRSQRGQPQADGNRRSV